MKHKILTLLLASIVIALALTGCNGQPKEPIVPPSVVEASSNVSIANGIETQLREKHGINTKVTVHNVTQLGSYKNVVFTTDNKKASLGSVRLTKNNDGQYAIYNVNYYGSAKDAPPIPTAEVALVNDGDDQYIKVTNWRYNIKPSKIKFKKGDKAFDINMIANDYSVYVQKLHQKLDPDTAQTSVIQFFDEKGTDITDKVQVVD